jgi:hypothetical protein
MLVGLVGLYAIVFIATILWALLLAFIDDRRLFDGLGIVHLIAKVIFSIAAWSVIALLVAARLKRLGWPKWLASIPVIHVLLSTPLLLAYQLIVGDLTDMPLWFMLLGSVTGALALILILVTLIWDESVSKDLPLRHRAILLVSGFLFPSLIVAIKGSVYEASLEGLLFLPELTEAILPLVQSTPYFLIGAIPAIVVLVSRELEVQQAQFALSISAAVFVVFVVWLWILWLALALPINTMNAIM